MIWLTWRQFRLQFLLLLVGFGLLASVLAVTGPGLLADFRTDAGTFLARISLDRVPPLLYFTGLVALYATPPVIGAFWGAPLIAREVEAGTHRLAWNQGVTRNRWLAAKLGLTGLAVVILTAALSLAVSWWAEPVDAAIAAGDQAGPFALPRMHPLVFGARGIVPIGYAVLAFALGVTLGLLLRRTVAAIGLTLVLVVAVQLAGPLAVREHLVEADRDVAMITDRTVTGLMLSDSGGQEQRTLSLKGGDPGDWITSNTTIRTGAVAAVPPWVEQCMGPIGTARLTDGQRRAQQACFRRLADEGYRQELVYQPSRNFWALQWREAGLLLALAGLLAGFSFWRINRDLT